MLLLVQKTVNSAGTSRGCGAVLSITNCVPSSSNHVSFSDNCNAGARPDTGHLAVGLFAAFAAVVIAAVGRIY